MVNFKEKITKVNPAANRVVFAIFFFSVAVLRVYYCTQLPAQTGDILRHMCYGAYVWKTGLSAAGSSLTELNPYLERVSWSGYPYNYPIMTLLFFAGLVKVSPTIFFAKLALTALEGLNSMLVYKYSRQPILALIYWSFPVSVWWVSHEGQFEPLQNFFVLCALVLLANRKSLSLCMLALAAQVKVTGILLLPYFLVDIKRKRPEGITAPLAAFGAGLLPTLIALFYYPAIRQVLSTGAMMRINQYYWNFLDYSMFGGSMTLTVIFGQVASYGLLIVLVISVIIYTIKKKEVKSFIAPLSFILFCKISTIWQPWYFVLLLPFLLPIKNRKVRLGLFVATLFLDILSPIQIFAGPLFFIGNDFLGLTPFSRIGL
jgi:hypothetical protein